MQFLVDLWLPIVVSAVAVFIASSVVHMATPMHKSDHRKMPNEDQVLEALRAHGVGPGEYMFPMAASMKDCASPEMVAKFNRGPVGSLIVLPAGGFAMGKSLLQWFLYTVFVGVFVAYVAAHALGLRATPPGNHAYLEVFRIAGTVATGIYALSNVTNSIWKGVSWKVTAKFAVDGLIYGLLTAGVFGWLWPHG